MIDWFIVSSLVAGPFFAISPLGRYDNGYPEQKYQEVLDTFERVYSPVIAAKGGTFGIMRDWSDGAVNMWAWRIGNEYLLEIPGGMARYHLINEEAFVLSICHELGHLLGGAPARGDISLEGQADYYATLECIETILPEVAQFKELDIHQEVIDSCDNLQNQAICHRSLMGSLSLTSYYAELENRPPPQLSTPSLDKVSKTLETHPPSQCRLDTFYAGYLERARPLCWHAESHHHAKLIGHQSLDEVHSR